LKGFSNQEINNWTYSDLIALDEAIENINKENNQGRFLAVNYHNLTNQTSYLKNGKVNEKETKSLRQKGSELIGWIFGRNQIKKEMTIDEKIQWQKEMAKKLTESENK